MKVYLGLHVYRLCAIKAFWIFVWNIPYSPLVWAGQLVDDAARETEMDMPKVEPLTVEKTEVENVKPTAKPVAMQDMTITAPENNKPEFPAEPKPVAQETILYKSLRWVTAILNHHRLHEKLHPQAVALPTKKHSLSQAALKDPVERVPDGAATKNAFSQGSMAAVADEITRQNEYLRKLTEGVRFEMDFSNLFSIPEPPSEARPVRYDLVLKEISMEPKSNRDDSASEKGLSSDAAITKPIWTIGPIYDEVQPVRVSPSLEGRASQPSFFDTPMPSARIKGKVTSSSPISSNTASSKLPPFSLELAQKEDFYQINIPISPAINKDAAIHIFRLPISGPFSLSQIQNSQFNPIESSANQILSYQGAPIINLRYFHGDQKFGGEWIIRKAAYELVLQGKARQNWSSSQGINKEAVECNLSYIGGL